MKHNVDYLDLVIIRSCQLACEGCCTFSDHREINGYIGVEDAEPAVAHWSKYTAPGRIHLYGGEPTMHPQLLEWVKLARKYWPLSADSTYKLPIWLNTNGYFLDKLFDHIDELFVDNRMFVSVTHHTTEEPYASLVLKNYEKLQELIITAYNKKYPGYGWKWVTGSEWDSGDYKIFKYLTTASGNQKTILLNMTQQHGYEFVPHYQGHGSTLRPWHDYNNNTKLNINHSQCHIHNYVQLYDNKLWKCPPRAVLNQTLETYDLQSLPEWQPYYTDYKPLAITDSEEAINQWFETQKSPENTCNMCGFEYRGTIPAQQHLPKKLFKIKQINTN
jgi:organic radical activating enzyme